MGREQVSCFRTQKRRKEGGKTARMKGRGSAQSYEHIGVVGLLAREFGLFL